jgi:hypothetical protein
MDNFVLGLKETATVSQNAKICRYINRMIPPTTNGGATFVTPHTAPEPAEFYGWVSLQSDRIKHLQDACAVNDLDFCGEVREAIDRHLKYIEDRPQREAKKLKQRTKRIMRGSFFSLTDSERQERDKAEADEELRTGASDALCLANLHILNDGFDVTDS